MKKRRTTAENARRAARATWPIRRYRLGEEPTDDLSHLTPDERLALVDELSLRMWLLSGRKLSRLPRFKWPGKLTRIR